MTEQAKVNWRELVAKVINEFELKVYPAMPLIEFYKVAGRDPLSIMVEDRGPQITFEVVNGYDLTLKKVNRLRFNVYKTNERYDIRIPIIQFAKELLNEHDLTVSPRLGGVFAVDFVVNGVSKTTAISKILNNKVVLDFLDLNKTVLKDPTNIEIWGDKFSVVNGGSDRHMSEALPKKVRSIDFRKEDPEELLRGYNIQVWPGKYELHNGLLEYLRMRSNFI